MYVEWDIDNHIHLLALRQSIDNWQTRYGIPVRQKTVRYRHRLGLDDESNFTVFFLTWTGPEFRVIHSRNH